MRAVWAAWIGLGGMAGCAGDPVPECADLRHSPITVDVGGPAPVFSFDGDRPHGFAVVDADGLPQWEVVCGCPADGCVDGADFEARACIPSPVTYGEVPDVRNLDQGASLQLEALQLVTGSTYTAIIWSDCANNGPSKVAEAEDFVAP
jgi:hypothetical protein